MYAVNVMYPRSDDRDFDLEEYLAGHMCMGLGLLWDRCSVKPSSFLMLHDTFGLDRTGRSTRYALISTMLFEDRKSAEAFIDLFEMTEPAELLSDDWQRFTSLPPDIVLAEVSNLSADDFIAKSGPVIEAARQKHAGSAS